jgi:hypothetical protein
MTDDAGGAIQAIGTAGFFARNLYIEGTALTSSTNKGIFLDGGTAACIFSNLNNIICNHIKIGLRLGTTGSTYVTSTTVVGFNAQCDLLSGSIGIQVDASCGQGSSFHGGNIENCATGVSISGLACSFFGLRSEGNNTVDVVLNSGTHGNAFFGCYGFTTVTDNSGNSNNTFLGNYDNSGGHYPLDTLSTLANVSTSGALTFGPDSAVFTEGNTGSIANNGTVTVSVSGHCFTMTLTESDQNTACQLLITPSAGVPITLGTVTASIYSTTLGTASKINFGYSGGNLTIENKRGVALTVNYVLLKVRS